MLNSASKTIDATAATTTIATIVGDFTATAATITIVIIATTTATEFVATSSTTLHVY
jgi:hypothetical protein